MSYRVLFRRVGLLAALSVFFATAAIGALPQKADASPPDTLVLTTFDQGTGKTGTTECKLQAGTVNTNSLFMTSSPSSTGLEVGREYNYQNSQSGGASIFDDILGGYGGSNGDNVPINFITAASIDGVRAKDVICSQTLFYLQDPNNPGTFSGNLITDFNAVKGCSAELTISDFSSGQAKITGLCGSADTGKNIKINGLTTDLQTLPGATAPGGGGAPTPAQYNDYEWSDVKTIIRGTKTCGTGAASNTCFLLPSEVYKWSPALWGGNSEIRYKLVDSPLLSPERRKLLQNRVDISDGSSCVPYISFSQDGSGRHSLDFGLDNNNIQDSLNGIKDALSAGGTIDGYLYDAKVSGSGCEHINGDGSVGTGKKVVPIPVSKLKLWFNYTPADKTAHLLFDDANGSEEKFADNYTLDSTNHTLLVMNSQPSCTTIKTSLKLTQDITTAKTGDIINGTWLAATNCGESNEIGVEIPILVRVLDATATAVAPIGNAGGGTNGSGSNSAVPNCEDSIQDGFGWLLCPILHWTDDFVAKAESEIKDQLTVRSDSFTNAGLKQSWTAVARVSSALLVMIALVMVVSTAMGFGVFDAYTVKKVLPRLVIAAVGIWLSWLLVTTYISIMNDVGKGIADLIFSPFGAAQSPKVTYSQVDLSYLLGLSSKGSGTLAGFAITGGVIVALLASGGIFAILGALVPLAAFIALGFIILTLRQAVIVFLLVLAPLGIVMWILPGTQKMWKLWSGTLNKLLIMFPMFMGLFAAAKIFALITATGSDGSLFRILIPMLAYISPFIFLPALFKAAGGIFSNLTGMVNNKGKGLFDRGQNALKKRGELSNRSLAKKQRDQIRTQKRQTSFAAGMTTSKLAGARRVRYGGLRDRTATRDKMQAAAIGLSSADEDKNLKDAEVLLSREAAYNNMADLEKIATDPKQTEARRRAAMNRLATRSSTNELARIKNNLATTNPELWDKFARSNGDLRDFAPHLAFDINTPQQVLDTAFDKASAEKAAKWSADTWAEANRLNPEKARQLAVEINNDPQLWRSQGGAWDAKTSGVPADGKWGGNRDFFGRMYGLDGTPVVKPGTSSGSAPTPSTPTGSGTLPIPHVPSTPAPTIPPPAGPLGPTTPTTPPPAGPLGPTSPPPAGPSSPPPPPTGPWVPPTT